MQVACLAVQGLGGIIQLLRAVAQLPRAVVQIANGGDQLIYLIQQLRIVHINIQIQAHTVDSNGFHLKVRHLGGDCRIYAPARQNGIGQLLVAAHIGHGRTVGSNAFATVGVQRERGLQRVILIKAARAAFVFADGKAYLQRTAFPRYVLSGVFPSVQKVTDGDVPRDNGAFHRPLIVHSGGGGGNGYLIPLLRDGVVGVQHFHGGVIAVVGDVAARENIHRLDVRHPAGGIGQDIDDLLLFRGCGVGERRNGQRGQQQRGEHRRRDFLHRFHWEIPSFSFGFFTMRLSSRYSSPGRTNSTMASEQSVPLPRK